MITLEDELIEFAIRLPYGDRAEHLERLEHCRKFGTIITIENHGVLKGYAECFTLHFPPTYPAIPWPKSVSNGQLVYVFSAVCEPGYIRKLLRKGKHEFRDRKLFCYHRHKHQNKLYIERI